MNQIGDMVLCIKEHFLTDWVNPSGMEEDGYCKTVPTILTSMDDLKSGESKKLKINR